MKCCTGLCGLMTASSLLLPLWAAAESHLQAGTVGRKLSATAHVDFRIVIPQVLSVGLAGGDTPGPSAQKVAIFSNSRNVTLTATSGSMPAAANNVMLRAAARKVIAREAACRLPADSSRSISPETHGMICTVSMP